MITHRRCLTIGARRNFPGARPAWDESLENTIDANLAIAHNASSISKSVACSFLRHRRVATSEIYKDIIALEAWICLLLAVKMAASIVYGYDWSLHVERDFEQAKEKPLMKAYAISYDWFLAMSKSVGIYAGQNYLVSFFLSQNFTTQNKARRFQAITSN